MPLDSGLTEQDTTLSLLEYLNHFDIAYLSRSCQFWAKASLEARRARLHEVFLRREHEATNRLADYLLRDSPHSSGVERHSLATDSTMVICRREEQYQKGEESYSLPTGYSGSS